MSKINVTLDAGKLRELVGQRTYRNKENVEVTIQEIKFELIPMKPENQKTIFEKDNLKIVKTHFAVAPQTKEEREANVPVNYIGEGFTNVWANANIETKAEIINPTTTAKAPF
jgi:hypothetical protein